MDKTEDGGLVAFIESHRESILQDWEDFARLLVPLADMDKAALRDHADLMLKALVRNMQAPQSEQARADKAKGGGGDDSLTDAAEEHAIARLDDNFSLDQLLAEFRAIRASVLRQWSLAGPPSPRTLDEVMRFNEAIDQAVCASVTHYSVKLDEARAVILGVLAHDLRNPLSAIAIGLQVILRNECADGTTMKAAVRALRSVDRMDDLVRDLLDFTLARLGKGLPILIEPVDLAILYEKIVEEVEAAYPGRTLRLKVSGNVHGQWDPARLSQMLINLLANAMNHGSPDGEVTVSVVGNATAVEVKVHNLGPVIPALVCASMFEPLNHAAVDRRTGSPGSSGLGLGLYIASQIATGHRGSLAVTSSEAEGTTFTASLPRGPAS